MDLPAPRFVVAHGVLAPPEPFLRGPDKDEAFIAAAGPEFPNVLSRQYVAPEMPFNVPHLVLASTSSQLALSASQADFEVRFYGDYVNDAERCLQYVDRKLMAVLSAVSALGRPPAMVGLIATMQFSLRSLGEDAATRHILATHLRGEFDVDDVQEALARVGLKVEDKYFVTLTVAGFQARRLQRPLLPGMQTLQFKPWEGELDDYGIELSVDINNRLEAITKREDPVVTEQGVGAVVELLRHVASTTGPQFVETGQASVSELVTPA